MVVAAAAGEAAIIWRMSLSPRTLVLLAGPSGSGKSRLARAVGAELPIASLGLDDFYRDEDYPHLPRTLGIVDWDDPATWDADAAVDAAERVLTEGHAEVPVYDLSQSRRVASREVTVGDARVVLAEGIFAIEMLALCRRRGLAVTPIWLDRSRPANFVRRLVRDLAEHRKPPWVLLRRGVALGRAESALRHRALGAGFRPASMKQAHRLIVGCARSATLSS